MKKGQYSDEQIVAILQQAERGEKTLALLCQEHNVSENTFYRWRQRFGGSAPGELARTREMEKELEKENVRLKRLLAERDLENDILKELLAKK